MIVVCLPLYTSTKVLAEYDYLCSLSLSGTGQAYGCAYLTSIDNPIKGT